MNKSKARGFSPMMEWNQVNWRKLERRVFKLQKRIFKASRRGDVKAARRLQKTLMNSWSAKCLAVRRVTQDNKGKKTAGVDGKKSLSPEQRFDLAMSLKLRSKSAPTRRVWIPKQGCEEKRPLGIPTMYDRALQSLVKLALEPEWEARFEPNSYGFRPGRSCQDAIQAILASISKKPKYVLDADIEKFFDRIDHKALLKKINTYPTLRRQIRSWLRSGVIDSNQYVATSEGTPQGGVISPLLANIALHGMENRISQVFPALNTTRTIEGKRTRIYSSEARLIRYADDFVILHEDITVIQRCKEIISEWLNDMGLELKPSKTKIVHTLDTHEDNEPGFNFLGFNVRQHPVGKHHSGKRSNKELLGFKTIITPASYKQKEHYKELAKTIESNKSVSQSQLIARLNPIIRGWANYYSTVVSTRIYSRLDKLVYHKLKRWAERRHPNKSKTWVAKKYWQTYGGDHWVFATKQEDRYSAKLLKHAATPLIQPYEKVKGDASPYDGNLVYWSTRLGEHPETPKRVSKLLKAQKGKCAHCGLHFREGDVIEVDHKVAKANGGKDEYKNLQLLHRHCHDVKTALEANTQRAIRDNEKLQEYINANPW